MPGFGSVGVWEVILILAILLLVFGAKRLPEIGAALGKGIREFKGSVRDIESEINRPSDRRTELPRSDSSATQAGSEPPRERERAPGAESDRAEQAPRDRAEPAHRERAEQAPRE